MLIDWFTVCAQALNFLILVWLMRRFLYQPVLSAIDTREKWIAAELADASAKKAEAQKDRDDFQHKNEEFDKQRTALLTEAAGDANAEKQRILDAAGKAADALSATRQGELTADTQALNQGIGRRTLQEVFAIARKTLTDLANVTLEERMGAGFTLRLRSMEGQAKDCFATALRTASEPALIRSTFDLPAEQRSAIQNSLKEAFSADVPLRFETTPELISGIELTANGQKVSWSIANYLTSMEDQVTGLLNKQPA